MKRILLAIFISIGSLNAQIEIHIENSGPDVSGTIVDFTFSQTNPDPLLPLFFVTNNTGADAQWRITRVKQNVPTVWTDQLFWPPNGYATYGDIYTTPSTTANPAPIVTNGTNNVANYSANSAVLRPFIQSNGSTDLALYMYYITDTNDVYVDSIGIRYNYVLGIEENAPALSVSVSPNPASSYFKVTANNATDASVQVVDVLGNVVLKETVMGNSKTINTANFRNGIYFVKVTANKQRSVIRKVIVKH